ECQVTRQRSSLCLSRRFWQPRSRMLWSRHRPRALERTPTKELDGHHMMMAGSVTRYLAAPVLIRHVPVALEAIVSCTHAQPSRRRAQLPAETRRRLRTGCVGDELYHETYTLLVTRAWPLHLAEEDIHEWWPALAPSLTLLRMRRGAGNTPM